MTRKLILLLLIVVGGLGCWFFYQKSLGAKEGLPAITKKPSPAGAPVATVQSSAAALPVAAPPTESPKSNADSAEAEKPSSFVAMRLDNTHIYVALTNAAESPDPIDTAKEARSLTKVGDGAKLGVGPVFQVNDELLTKYQEQFEPVHVGEKWELELSPESRVGAVVTAPVVIEAGCVASPGFIAQIAAADQLPFTSATATGKEYFLLHKPDAVDAPIADPTAKPIGELADWKVTPEFGAPLQKLLNERMQQELVKIRKQDVQEFERFNPKGKPWPKIDEKLARGEGRLDYDTQAFQLTADGVPRIYVRARWTVDGKAAFFMGAWVKADAAPSIDAVDTGPAGLMRLYEMRGTKVDFEDFPKILNIFDPQREHQAQLLIYSHGYEGMDINVYRYTSAGPERTRVSVGGGC